MTSIATRVAIRHVTAQKGHREILQKALQELKKLQSWSRAFPTVLREALKDTEDLPDGYVWQDEFVEYWTPFDPIERRMFDILDDLAVYPEIQGEVEPYLDPPKGSRVTDAISDPLFMVKSENNRPNLAYSVKRLKAWNKNFTRWVQQSIRGVEAALRRKA